MHEPSITGAVPRSQVLLAALAALALRLLFILRFPAEAGDTVIYDALARNWLQFATYGLFINNQLTPVDIRVPGYPAFLAAIYSAFGYWRLAVMLAQALLDVATCFLTAALAVRLGGGRRAATAALWLAALCPFTANYTAVLLTETLATFFTTLAAIVWLDAWEASKESGASVAAGKWLWCGLLTGLGALVRPEAPMLLAAFGVVLAASWWRTPARLWRAALCLAAGLLLPLVPWGLRNWHSVGRLQLLAPRYAELPGEFVTRGFFAWTKTWLTRYGDVYRSLWKLETEPIKLEDLPASAFDSPEERARVAALLARYNETTTVPPEMDAEFARLARERTARHPLRTYLWVPLGRAASIWFTPRIELLPYSGGLFPVAVKWEEDPWDFSFTLGFGALNFIYAGLALAGTWRARRAPATAFLVVFLLLRTAFLTQVEAPEPRYLLVGFPMLLAPAAQLFHKPEPSGSC